jgi:hypothetical protein
MVVIAAAAVDVGYMRRDQRGREGDIQPASIQLASLSSSSSAASANVADDDATAKNRGDQPCTKSDPDGIAAAAAVSRRRTVGTRRFRCHCVRKILGPAVIDWHPPPGDSLGDHAANKLTGE